MSTLACKTFHQGHRTSRFVRTLIVTNKFRTFDGLLKNKSTKLYTHRNQQFHRKYIWILTMYTSVQLSRILFAWIGNFPDPFSISWNNHSYKLHNCNSVKFCLHNQLELALIARSIFPIPALLREIWIYGYMEPLGRALQINMACTLTYHSTHLYMKQVSFRLLELCRRS